MSLVRGSAFVTGGGSGIGRAIAEALAARGAAVAVFDLLADGGKETVGAIEARGGRARFLQGDASRWADVDAAVAPMADALGPLGILVNAAGILDGYAPADELTLAVWERVVGINLTGTFVGCKRALAEMLLRSAGRIVNIASVAGVVGSTRILGRDAPEMRGIGGDEAAVRAITPAGRRGTLEEVTAAACYLAGEEVAYVTGQTLVIDGGWTAR